MENTLEAALKQWKEREQRYEKLFSPSALKSREFIREKLNHFDGLRAKVLAGSLNEDALAMRALQLERRQLARQAYPNLIIRLLESAISAFKLDRNVARLKTEGQNNNEAIRDAMEKAGLGRHYSSAEQMMKQGVAEFKVPVSYHVNEKERMDLNLSFKKDNGGRYLFEGYKASLYNEAEKGKPRQHTFFQSEALAVNSDQAYNLLSGRAVQQHGSSPWQQLDFNDKDGSGNYRTKQFPESYGFKIEEMLSALPLDESNKSGVLTALKNGDKVPVVLSAANKETACFLAADPHRKEINIYNDAGGKVTLEQLNHKAATGRSKSKVLKMLPKQNEARVKQKGNSAKL